MSTPSAGREGRAPAATPTSDAPAMMPASSAGPFRDDPPVESARALAGAADGESKGGANPPGGSKKHECPDDPGEFFAQLFMVLVFKPDPPEGYEECRICGGLVPERTRR